MLAFIKAFDNFDAEEKADCASAAASVPAILRKSRASDVAKFWEQYGLGSVINVRELVDSLYDYASEAGVLPLEREDESSCDNVALVEFFAGRSSLKSVEIQ
jgi:hypothetical protein